MRKKQTQKEQNNMEVLILDSGYVPQSQKKQTEKSEIRCYINDSLIE